MQNFLKTILEYALVLWVFVMSLIIIASTAFTGYKLIETFLKQF
jgi:hypothetical protein